MLFDRAQGALRSGPWVQLGCPSCGAAAYLELAGEHVAIGRVVRERGSRFEPAMRVRQPGLRVKPAPDSIQVELLHRSWIFERRDA